MQQGGSPTPFDRNMGTKMAAKAVEWMITKLKEHVQPDGSVNANTPETAVMIGVVRRQYRFTPLTELKKETDFE
jgi:6-phosphofructokinase 1